MTQVRVPAFAKLNLDLRVLYKRPDGYHELRSVFQTISLADRIQLRFARTRRTEIRIAGNVDIPDNLIVRAAHAVLEELRISAAVEFALAKRIPMGAGLGGGSSDAAAVLLSLPTLVGKRLAGKRIAPQRLMQMAAQLGSDVPFFLVGGTAAVLGRGEELYPLEDLRAPHVLLVAPGIHVSTPDAYRALSARLTPTSAAAKLSGFQSLLWTGSHTETVSDGVNDFEDVVFEHHPRLRTIRNQLRRAGATTAMMTGSGSTIFGIFPDLASLNAAKARFHPAQVHAVRFVTRTAYRATWNRALAAAVEKP